MKKKKVAKQQPHKKQNAVPAKKPTPKSPQKPVKRSNPKPIAKQVKKPAPKKKPPKKKMKLRYDRIFAFFILLCIFYLIGNFLFQLPIKNIYISGNTYLSDQEIIDLAGIENYPSILGLSKTSIKKKLEENIYIQSAKITKRNLSELSIEITENNPLFYYKITNRTMFQDKREMDGILASIVLINYVPDLKYLKLVEKIVQVEPMILKRISIMEYDPNNVDDERFLLTMADGNYVYLTLEKFDSINNYLDIMKNIIKTHGNKKGILYLDAGEYFKIME